MKRVFFKRIEQSENAILSTISSPDEPELDLYALERQWNHNRSDISCVPAGVYGLLPWKSAGFGEVYTFVGGTVTPHKADVPAHAGRWGNHLHVANYWSDLLGCVAPGMRRGEKDGDLCVWSSRDALKVFRDIMGYAPLVAYISWEVPTS
jgi:hypothetical protein